ncbi:hypothetical protein SmJEL517_g01255 [Synchytrium microbalum]|uniref:Homeobox domain-containing protein n=1 Tax=Synchytrium microbalum TaxID=1806994 RepID=A0A507CAE9_9FUNG|nr:uncharacterized protein SmJEL517_g01255 [Synchytrium microbalum]TPX36582.1 hypothetical protein SmJEL517_g01255 [Synchytrium microbalum]
MGYYPKVSPWSSRIHLDVTPTTELLSPPLSPSIPYQQQCINSTDEIPDLSLAPSECSLVWSDYRDIGGDLFDLETVYLSPPASDDEEASCCQDNTITSLQGLKLPLSPLESLDGDDYAMVTDTICDTMINDETKTEGDDKAREVEPAAQNGGSGDGTGMKGVVTRTARRDAGVDVAASVDHAVLHQNMMIQEDEIEEDTNDNDEDPDCNEDTNAYNNDSDYDDQPPKKQEPNTRRKRQHHILTINGRINKRSLAVFSKVFQVTCYPETTIRNMLAERLDMTPRAVQIWFQNKRQQMKALGAGGGLRSKKGGRGRYKEPDWQKLVAAKLPMDVAMWCDELDLTKIVKVYSSSGVL